MRSPLVLATFGAATLGVTLGVTRYYATRREPKLVLPPLAGAGLYSAERRALEAHWRPLTLFAVGDLGEQMVPAFSRRHDPGGGAEIVATEIEERRAASAMVTLVAGAGRALYPAVAPRDHRAALLRQTRVLRRLAEAGCDALGAGDGRGVEVRAGSAARGWGAPTPAVVFERAGFRVAVGGMTPGEEPPPPPAADLRILLTEGESTAASGGWDLVLVRRPRPGRRRREVHEFGLPDGGAVARIFEVLVPRGPRRGGIEPVGVLRDALDAYRRAPDTAADLAGLTGRAFYRQRSVRLRRPLPKFSPVSLRLDDFLRRSVSPPERRTMLLRAKTFPGAGAGACRACHPGRVARWRDGPHARSLASLRRIRAEWVPGCVGCHRAGWPAPDSGGWQPAVDATEPEGVGCSSCHRPLDNGREVAHSWEKTVDCARCHTTFHSPGFPPAVARKGIACLAESVP